MGTAGRRTSAFGRSKFLMGGIAGAFFTATLVLLVSELLLLLLDTVDVELSPLIAKSLPCSEAMHTRKL